MAPSSNVPWPDTDALSASQVVRRLESLGPEELQAIHRYEAAYRNRRTIINRAHQLLDGMTHDAPPSSGSARRPIKRSQ